MVKKEQQKDIKLTGPLQTDTCIWSLTVNEMFVMKLFVRPNHLQK